MDTRNAGMDVGVVDGKLVISIGVETLAHCFNNSVYANPYSYKKSDFVQVFKVTNPDEFTVEVVRALQHEGEDGTTMLHVLLDKACENAVEDGALGVEDLR